MDNTPSLDRPLDATSVEADKLESEEANRDPLTGAPGMHAVGTGIGAAAGGMAAGAAIGTMAGPVGTAIGAAIGAIAGGLVGKGVAELVDPTVEESYWRVNYADRPYVEPGASYDDYGPAYRYGVDAYAGHAGRGWDDVEPDLALGWQRSQGTSSLEWDRARHASRDAWTRLSEGAYDPKTPEPDRNRG